MNTVTFAMATEVSIARIPASQNLNIIFQRWTLQNIIVNKQSVITRTYYVKFLMTDV